MAPQRARPPKSDPDQALVDRCKAGDVEAYDQLVGLYQRKVIQLCFNHLNQYEEACDLAQEVFVQVYHNLGGFKGQSRFSTWLYRVTLNACYNRQKWMGAKGRNKVGSLEGLLEKDQIDPGHSALFRDPALGALDRMEQRETTASVREAMGRLTPEYQKVVELVDLEGMSYDEAADVIGIPVNTVRSRLSRAREGLKKVLVKMGVRP